jgi:PPOX class probable F420-dependent enzyme
MAAELSDRQRALLEGPNFYTVCTIGKDGGPRATTIWGHVYGDLIEVNSAEGRGWPTNVKRDPRVAIAVHEEGNPYNQLSIIGHAVEMTTEGGQESINRLSEKYTGNANYPTRPGETRVRIRIAIDRVRSWG